MTIYRLSQLQKLYPNFHIASDTWTHTELKNDEDSPPITFHWNNLIQASTPASIKRFSLISEAKNFFSWFLISEASESHRYNAIATIVHKFDDLRSLLKWMASVGYSSFSEIEPDKLESFYSYRTQASKRFFIGQKLQRRTVSGRQYLLRNLYKCYKRIGVGLHFDPDTASNFQEIFLSAPNDQFEPLPENVAVGLLSDAIKWIQGPALEFLDAIDECKKRSDEGIPVTGEIHKLYNRVVEEGLRARLCSHLMIETDITAGQLLGLGRKESVAACLFIICHMTGVRVGSLIKLSTDCVKTYQHSDGEFHSYLEGFLTKGGTRPHRWIADGVVIEAVEMLNRVSAPARALSGRKNLLSSMKGPTVLPSDATAFSTKGARDVNDLLKHFCLSHRRSIKLPKTYRIHAHQGRKTFGRFVGMRDKSALGALAGYYGHMNLAITDSSYIGTDIDLNTVLEEESLKDLAAGLENMLTSPRLGGKAGEYISEKSGFKRKFRGKAELRKTVEHMIASGVLLAPCNWGYCVYRQELSACRGDWKGPNDINREPGLCSGCQNFCVTLKHEAWWKERLIANQNFLERHDLPDMTITMVMDRVKQCENVLNSLNSDKDASDAKKKNGNRRGSKKPY